MGSRFVVVVEVSTVAARSDWAELGCLTGSYVRVQASRRLAQSHRPPFLPGALIALHEAPALLTDAIRSLRVCDVSFPLECTWTSMEEVDFTMRLYQVCEDATPSRQEAAEDAAAAPPVWAMAGGTFGHSAESDQDVPAFTVTQLPHASLEGQWESLYYGESEAASILFKRDIVSYVDTAMRFARAGVNPHLIAWNRLVLFYGPPGTGKTSLCRALAQKLAIRLSACGFPRACLVDINAHSLFSRWFSESGKQVLHLFEQIHRIAADSSCLVCCVMDEVESLAAARASAMKGNEPSDSIRVVNALLTQIDRLQRRENILLLSTSNLTGAIDDALLDRADKRIFVGPPGLHARQVILQTSVQELLEKGLIAVLDVDECGASKIRVDVELSDSTSHKPIYGEAGAFSTTPERVCATALVDKESMKVGMGPETAEMSNEEVEHTVPPAELKDFHTSHWSSSEAHTTLPADHESAGSPRRQPPRGLAPSYTLTSLLGRIAEVSEGLNGRTLKKLPFLAYGSCMCTGAGGAGHTSESTAVDLTAFLEALFDVTRRSAAEATAKQAVQKAEND